MKLVNNFLARFQNLTPPDDSLKKAVANAVFSIANIPVKKNDISITNGIAFVRCSSVAKSVLNLKRGAILKEVFEEIPKARTALRDIR